MTGLRHLLVLACALAVSAASARADDTPEKKPSKLRSPDDGWLDLSAFLDEPYGFVPMAFPITEPAVGYGAGGALTFVGKPEAGAASGGFERPNISALGGLGTENGTWAAFGADLRHWKAGRLQTLAALIDGSVNLDFYGTGNALLPQGQSVEYTLEPLGGMLQARFRATRTSPVWAGLGYTFARVRVAFDAPEDTPGLPSTARETHVGGLTPMLTYDSRDNMFTPARGTYVDGEAGFYGSSFGGDDDFQKLALIAMQFVPLHRSLTLGLRGDLGATYGDAPFYLRPYVATRGAPAMRYQRDRLAQAEGELRWQLWMRISVVGFAGYGAAWNERRGPARKVTVTTGGGGLRYELARRYKLHIGADVGFGPDGAALYVIFGSAWMRP